jgi:hypothetical protein
MANKNVAARLKGFVSNTNDEAAGGYDLLGRTRDAGLFFATGQVPTSSRTSAADPLDQQLKMQRLLANTPEEKLKRAQAMGGLKAEQEQDQVDNKRKMIQEGIDSLGGQSQPASGASFGMSQPTSQDASQVPQSLIGESPVSQMAGSKVPQFLQTQTPKIDPTTGMVIPEFGLRDNREYLDPEQRAKMERQKQKEAMAVEQNKLAEEEGKKASADMLDTITQIKSGKQYFGPAGDLPSQVAPSSFDPVKNPLVPLGFDSESYGKRANWQSHMDKLVASKVFETIQKMQAASKTGATGLGPISEPEFRALQSASTALNKSLNPEDAMRILGEMEAIQRKFLNLPAEQTTSSGIPDDQAYQEYLNMVGGR